MTELEALFNTEGLAANSTLLLLHILTVTLQEKAELQDELRKTKDKVETLESVCQNNRVLFQKSATDSLVSHLANISAALQAKADDGERLCECQQKLMETQHLLQTLPEVLNGRTMKDSALDAAKTGSVNQLQIILDAGGNVDTADNEGRSLLNWASLHGHVQIVRLLLERNATVDQPSPGWLHNTPMMNAAWEGHIEIVRLLLEHGGTLEHKNDNGHTELHHAALRGHLPVVKLLVEKGANILAKVNNESTIQMAQPNVAEWLKPRVPN